MCPKPNDLRSLSLLELKKESRHEAFRDVRSGPRDGERAACAVAIAGLGDPCLRAAVWHGLLGVSRRLASAERIWRGFSGERLSTVCRPGVSTNHARYRVAAGCPDY